MEEQVFPDLQLAIVAKKLQDAEHPIKVLAAEDNPVFQTMISNLLIKWGYQPVVARDGDEAWQALQEPGGPQLAILDWMMPGMSGLEICRRVRAAGQEPYIYILLLTARTNSQDLVEGMDAGADDYVTKPFQAHELRVRLRAGRRIVDLQRELLAAREAIREQATHDGLTCLFNRCAVLDSLRKELARASREGQPLSLLMVDLDWFKRINDTYGHQAGDAVLREAAMRMQASIRSYDSLGRYGGEEFLIVLPGCDRESALAQAERVREAFAGTPFSTGTARIPVTCSIGAATCASPTGEEADSLLHEADLALYSAKDAGRNQVAGSPRLALV